MALPNKEGDGILGRDTSSPAGANVTRRHCSGRILVAEDDGAMRRLVAAVLRDKGYRVVEACDGAEMLDRIDPVIGVDRRDLFGAIVSDLNMPALSGLDALASLRSAAVDTPFILLTAFGDDGVRAEAASLGAVEVIPKPLDVVKLERAVRAALFPWMAGVGTARIRPLQRGHRER